MLQFLPQLPAHLLFSVKCVWIFKVATFQNTFCSVPRIIRVLWDKTDHKAWNGSAILGGGDTCDEGYWTDLESGRLWELQSLSIWLKYVHIARTTAPNHTSSHQTSRANTNKVFITPKRRQTKPLPFKTMFICIVGWVSAAWKKWSEIREQLFPALQSKINTPQCNFPTRYRKYIGSHSQNGDGSYRAWQLDSN